jgi:hypothetical protein
MTGWHGEQWDFENNGDILITRSWLDGMENSEIFKTMKRQCNILIIGSWLDGMENSGIFKTMKGQWNITGSWLDDTINAKFATNNSTRKGSWSSTVHNSSLITNPYPYPGRDHFMIVT